MALACAVLEVRAALVLDVAQEFGVRGAADPAAVHEEHPAGAATTIYAATAPELDGKSGAYLADCAIATPVAEALDDALVERVWQLSERCLASAAKPSV